MNPITVLVRRPRTPTMIRGSERSLWTGTWSAKEIISKLQHCASTKKVFSAMLKPDIYIGFFMFPLQQTWTIPRSSRPLSICCSRMSRCKSTPLSRQETLEKETSFNEEVTHVLKTRIHLWELDFQIGEWNRSDKAYKNWACGCYILRWSWQFEPPWASQALTSQIRVSPTQWPNFGTLIGLDPGSKLVLYFSLKLVKNLKRMLTTIKSSKVRLLNHRSTP